MEKTSLPIDSITTIVGSTLTAKQLRAHGFRMDAANVVRFEDGFYHGIIGLAIVGEILQSLEPRDEIKMRSINVYDSPTFAPESASLKAGHDFAPMTAEHRETIRVLEFCGFRLMGKTSRLLRTTCLDAGAKSET